MHRINDILKVKFCQFFSADRCRCVCSSIGNVIASDLNAPISKSSATEQPAGSPNDDLVKIDNSTDTLQKSRFLPSFNFAAYVNDSPTLQELVKLGVNLHSWEYRKGVPQFVLGLDFNQDMKPYLRFLLDLGIDASDLATFLTKNPHIFKEDLDDLTVRINYLESKRFSPDMITSVVLRNPYWLMFSTKRIDQRLGFFQNTFKLSGDEVRKLAILRPKLITYNMNRIKVNTFVIKEELGFTEHEMKRLILTKPKLWMINQIDLKRRFECVHLEMGVPHDIILQQPGILTTREFRIKERHLFLKSLNRAQYDPNLEGYVSLITLVSGDDAQFCTNVAKSSVDTFNMFLKTL